MLLLDRDNHILDAVSWGSSNWAFDPPVPAVADNHSIERYPANQDTNSAIDWRDQPMPAPGDADHPIIDPRTPSPTPSRTPTATLPYQVVINEILTFPPLLVGDANGDGVVDPQTDEFIEIVNTTLAEVDLSGWQLGDALTIRHIFPPGRSYLPVAQLWSLEAVHRRDFLAEVWCKSLQAASWGWTIPVTVFACWIRPRARFWYTAMDRKLETDSRLPVHRIFMARSRSSSILPQMARMGRCFLQALAWMAAHSSLSNLKHPQGFLEKWVCVRT